MNFYKIIDSLSRLAWLTMLIFVVGSHAFAADVVYLSRSLHESYPHQQIETVSAFYGLDVIRIAEDDSKNTSISDVIRNPKTVALVINADALSSLSRNQIFGLLQARKQRIPILVLGINEQSSPVILTEWSSGAILWCENLDVPSNASWYDVSDSPNVTRQLSHTRLPLNQKKIFYLKVGVPGKLQSLLVARVGLKIEPVFTRIVIEGQELFFATESEPDNIPAVPDPYRQQSAFAAVASSMMFLRYAGGASAWHTSGDYANFTIDDLWLREPYGHVNYEKLLQESERHNFHTTIAFIPWNFDRNQPEMISLFQAHSDRFSISIHGNNHIHQEFGPLDEHPLRSQMKDSMQGLARMEKLNLRTKLPYDAVMVFPHSISPSATFSALKGANYLATANSLSVPSDAATPPGLEFALRTSSLQFANFPSLRRYSAENEIPEPQLAIDAFLGNSMLFYAHESFFSNGIDAFDKTADVVNRIQPDIKWRSLGEIVRHLYLEKQRDDGNFDIRALSGTIQIENSHERDAVFFIEKDENFAFPLKVFVDGQPFSAQHTGTQLRLELPIAAGMSRLIEVKYNNGVRLVDVDISKTSIGVAGIRLLSDFRDNVVSDTRIGRWFIHSYVEYGRGWNCLFAILTLLLMALVVWLVRLRGVRNVSPTKSYSSI
jgi:hypothetical protein